MQMELYKERQQSNENSNQLKPVEAFQSLVQYVNELTDIVNKIKVKNEAEFLIAYQNHMKKIKAELKELRSKMEEQLGIQNQNNVKVTSSDNELVINSLKIYQVYFREECLKLYQKVELKNKEVYELRFKLSELQKSNEFLESQIKSLIKKVKLQEIDKELQPNIQLDQTFCTTTPANQHKFQKRRLTDYQSKVDMSSSLSKHHYSSIKEMFPADDLNKEIVKYEDILDKITKYVTIIEQKYQNQNRILNEKVQKLLISQNKKCVIRSELENFFLECVETVRKEVQKKRPLANFQQYQSYLDSVQDYSQFYKEDKIKILELVVSNEKLLVFIFQKLFPNHVNLVLQSIKEDTNLKSYLDQNLKNSIPNHQNTEEIINLNQLVTNYKVEASKTAREVRSVSLNKQLEVRRGKLLFKQF
ncbi:unnamed protein product (macronuclear) [Paramecium tetraurelia]|uniref:Uncharacterized protein n=1 Tax=Paramecium tetraurelia TaxID=5888 RepID=A0EFS6_PARTE|nr:uncharacterized protein GSPATT00026490001 [Paramecium tetraurelia]CAK94167.1 unnamed protein product [Paramecium tetraurelia]|eukprot:XP_001461540.1 hypothetical protein (macronuclear) [Paramecium tetraurelia strain d4-2]